MEAGTITARRDAEDQIIFETGENGSTAIIDLVNRELAGLSAVGWVMCNDTGGGVQGQLSGLEWSGLGTLQVLSVERIQALVNLWHEESREEGAERGSKLGETHLQAVK